jgi:hypothetical protein
MIFYNACMAFNERKKWALSQKCHAVGICITAMDMGCARNETYREVV